MAPANTDVYAYLAAVQSKAEATTDGIWTAEDGFVLTVAEWPEQEVIVECSDPLDSDLANAIFIADAHESNPRMASALTSVMRRLDRLEKAAQPHSESSRAQGVLETVEVIRDEIEAALLEED